MVAGCARVPDSEFQQEGSIRLVVGVEGGSVSKAELGPTTGILGAQFLRLDGSLVAPTDFTSGVSLAGDVAATTGQVSFTTTPKPLYNPDQSRVWLAAYYPAGSVSSGVVEWSVDGKTDILYTDRAWDAGTYRTPLTGSVDPKLTFKHALSQLEVVCVAQAGVSLPQTQLLWGKIKRIEFMGAPTTLRYSWNGLSTTVGSTVSDVALYADYNGTVLVSQDIQASGSTSVLACGMLAPVVATASESFKLRVTTQGGTADVADDIVVELPISLGGTKASMGRGYKHRVTLTFKAQMITATATVEAWNEGGTLVLPVE